MINVLLHPAYVINICRLQIGTKTKHDELIANSTPRNIAKLSIKHQKPVTLGISGPGMSERQAYARIRPVSENAVNAVQKIFSEIKRISK